MIRRILLSICILIPSLSFSTTYVTVSDGNWESPSTWSPAAVPNMSDTSTVIHVYHDITIPYNGQYNCRGHLTIYVGASIYTPNQFRVNGGHVVVWGYLQVHNNLWMENNGLLEVWYGGFVFVDNKITYDLPSTIYLRGGTICWHNLWKGGPPEGVGVEFNDPHLEGINGCYISTGPLGIDLVSFETHCQGNLTEIAWITENETNNSFFTIEKSYDLIQWILVTTCPADVNASGQNEYSVIDDDTGPGIWYYRISQTDVDGVCTIYNDQWLRYSNCYEPADLAVYPNPVQDILSLYGYDTDQGPVKVFDVYGSVVLQRIIGNDQAHIQVSSLLPGIYFLSQGNSKTIKFVKE
jgi:hypothetical protein